MKTLNTKLLFGLFAVLIFTSCKKEGCTDANATNYNADAGKDDGSCSYSGDVVFWLDEDTSDSLNFYAIPSVSLFLDNTLQTSESSSTFSATAPACGTTGTLSASVDFTGSSSATYHFEVKPEGNALVVWQGMITVHAGDCHAHWLKFSEKE